MELEEEDDDDLLKLLEFEQGDEDAESSSVELVEPENKSPNIAKHTSAEVLADIGKRLMGG